MRIPKGTKEFKSWARKTRMTPTGIIAVGSCVAYNLSLSKKQGGPDCLKIQAVLRTVAEECALRWMK